MASTLERTGKREEEKRMGILKFLGIESEENGMGRKVKETMERRVKVRMGRKRKERTGRKRK